eukprot:3851243-Prymnesium_polylepis.2
MFEWSCHGFDSLGNIVCEVFSFVHPKARATDPPGSVVTTDEYVEGIRLLQTLQKPVICTGNPELEEFGVANIRASETGDYSTGWDFQQAMLIAFTRFKHTGEKPFSIRQPMLVPCSGIRRGPRHRSKPDNFDEALCMMGMIRAIVRRYEF